MGLGSSAWIFSSATTVAHSQPLRLSPALGAARERRGMLWNGSDARSRMQRSGMGNGWRRARGHKREQRKRTLG